MQELCSLRATQSAVITNLEPNTRYEFMVRLHVDQISSSWSSVVYHQTLPAGNQTIRSHQFPSLSSYLDPFLLFVRLSSACEPLDNLKLWGNHAGLGLPGILLCSSDHNEYHITRTMNCLLTKRVMYSTRATADWTSSDADRGRHRPAVMEGAWRAQRPSYSLHHPVRLSESLASRQVANNTKGG